MPDGARAFLNDPHYRSKKQARIREQREVNWRAKELVEIFNNNESLLTKAEVETICLLDGKITSWWTITQIDVDPAEIIFNRIKNLLLGTK